MELTAQPNQPKRRYTLYTALIACGMMLAIYILLGIWPFGQYTVVTGDLGGLYLNYFSHLRRFFLGEAGFAYGFDKGLGGGLLGLYAYYYASPFNLLYLLFPVRWFPVAAAILFLAKTVLASTFFRVYIAHKFPKLGWRSVPLGLCYGFLAYGFAYAQNIMWHDVLLLLPLICMGIDRLATGGTAILYTAVLAVAIFSNFYIAYMACLFAVIYFFYTMILRTDAEKLAGWRAPLLRFGGGSLLAGGACAALLVPTLYNVNQTKGALLDYTFSWAKNFPLQRLPERFMWGSFALSDEYGEMPFVYCGMLVLVLVFAYFASKAISKREKLLSGGILLFLLISFWIRGLDHIWHGLKEPIWFPMRYSYIFCFFMVLLAGKALACKAAGRREVLIGGGVLFVALMVMAAFPIAISRSRILLSAVAALFFTFCLVLAGTATSLRRRQLIFGAITFVVAAELASNGYYIQRQIDQYTLASHQDRVDTAGGTVKAIQQADADAYRIADNDFFSLNDPMLLGYWGLSHFGSTQDAPAQSVLYNLGFRNYDGAGPYLSGGTAFADGVLGLRYLGDSQTRQKPAHWEETAIEAPLPVYENLYALPMLFAFDGSGMTDTRHGEYEDDLFAFQNDMYAEMGGDGKLFADVANLELLDANGTVLVSQDEVPVGGAARITAAESGTHYAWFSSGTLLLPMYINEQYSDLYFSPEHKGAICLGWLEAGETALVRWDNTAPIELGGMRAVRMDDAKLEAFVASAKNGAGQFQVEDGFVSGTVLAEGNRTALYTSIPYDENWQAEVNGQKVETKCFIGGLLSVPLQPGENAVTLQFSPKGSTAGWVITDVCLLLFAGMVVLETKIAKRKRQPLEAAQTGKEGEG